MDKIKTNDEIVVLSGKDKGKRGVVRQRVGLDRFIVDGINVAKKAVKPNPMTGTTGGIVDKVMPIHVSNVALFNVASGEADRVDIKLVDGKRVRVFKSSGDLVKAK